VTPERRFCRGQGVREIAVTACEGDFAWADLMTGLELKRTKTLAEGDDVWDLGYAKVGA
jgi:hypothetical protein